MNGSQEESPRESGEARGVRIDIETQDEIRLDLRETRRIIRRQWQALTWTFRAVGLLVLLVDLLNLHDFAIALSGVVLIVAPDAARLLERLNSGMDVPTT
jgi:hypothetical protein